MGVGLMALSNVLYNTIRSLRYAWKGPNGSLTINSPQTATILRYDVFLRRQTILVVPHPRVARSVSAVQCYSHVLHALFGSQPRSSRFTPHRYMYDPKKGGLPAVQAVKSIAMFNDPEIQSCAVSWLLPPHPVRS